MKKDYINLLIAGMLIVFGLLFASCQKEIVNPQQENKLKPNIAPDRPIKDTFVVAIHHKF